MGRFPFSFRGRISKDDPTLDRALAANFAKAATEEYVDAAVAGVAGGSTADASTTVKGVSKLSVAPASATDPIAAGTNDPRLSDARTPTSHASSHAAAGADPLTLAQSQVTNLTTDLAAKAPSASPALTGTPTAPTATSGTNTTQLATTAFVQTGLGTKANTSHTHAQSDVTNLTTDLAAKAPLASPTFTGTPAAPTATSGTNTTQLATTAFVQTGLGTKANTSHTHAQSDITNLTTDLSNKQPLDSDLTTIAGIDSGTSAGVIGTEGTGWMKRSYAAVKTSLALTKSDVGLGSVDNTSDAAKPVSNATQTALNAKADLASPALTGTPTAPTAAAGTDTTQIATTAFVKAGLDTKQPLDADLTTIAGLTATTDNIIQSKAGAWASRTPAQFKTDLALVKADVGLGSVDNTSDASKPVSTAQQAALDLKANLASPALTGTPTAPTATAGTNTTQIATTAFVTNAVSTGGGSSIPATIGDAKGDLIGFSAADTPVRIAGASAEGYGLVSAPADTAGVKWQPVMFSQVSGGYAQLSTDSGSSGDKISFSITGDNATPILIKARFAVGVNAATTITVRVRDGAGGTGTQYGYWQQPNTTSGSIYVDEMECLIGAFPGAKTIYLNLGASTGTPTMYGASALRCWVRAVWAPGYSNS